MEEGDWQKEHKGRYGTVGGEWELVSAGPTCRLDVGSKLLVSCGNPLCKERRESLEGEVKRLKNDIGYLQKTVATGEQERNEAMEDLAVVKAEAQIFRCDFEEERKDRERAQGFLEELYTNGQAVPIQKEMQNLQAKIATTKEKCKCLERELAKSKVLKLQFDSSKEVVLELKTQVEHYCRERDFYKCEYKKEKVNNVDLMKSKEVSQVQIERLTEEKRVWIENQGKWAKDEINTLTEQFQLAMRTTVSVTEELKKSKSECRELLKVAEDKIRILEKELSSVRRFTGRSTGELRAPRVVYYEKGDQYLPRSPNGEVAPPVRARSDHGDVQQNTEPVRVTFSPPLDDCSSRYPRQRVGFSPLTERLKDRKKYQEPLRAGGDVGLSPPVAAKNILHGSTVSSHQGMDIRAPQDRYRERVYQDPVRAGRNGVPTSSQEDSPRSWQGPRNMYHEPLQAEGSAGQTPPPDRDRRNHLHSQAPVASGQGSSQQQEKPELDDFIFLGDDIPNASALSTTNVASVDLSRLKPVVGDLSDAEFTSMRGCLENRSHINDGIGSDIEMMLEFMKHLRQEEQTKKVTNTETPFDPNLVCPECRKMYRIGEIQKFKQHVKYGVCANL